MEARMRSKNDGRNHDNEECSKLETTEELEGSEEETDISSEQGSHVLTTIIHEDENLFQNKTPVDSDEYEIKEEEDMSDIQDEDVDLEYSESSPNSAFHSEDVEEMQPDNSFKCDICNEKISEQFAFFEHLRTHYDDAGDLQTFPPIKKSSLKPDVFIPSTTPSASSPSILRRRLKLLKERTKATLPTNLLVTQRSASPNCDDDITNKWIQCSHLDCEEVFRNQKALKSHVTSAHKSEDNSDNTLVELENRLSSRYLTRATTSVKIEVVSAVKSKSVKEISDPEDDSHMSTEEEEDQDTFSPPQKIGKGNKRLKIKIKKKNSALKVEETKEEKNDHLCHECGDFFDSETKLNKHKKTYHSSKVKEKPVAKPKSERRVRGSALKCKLCSKIFNHKNSLVYHMKGHNGERNYECEECKKKFLTSSALTVHKRLHSGEKPYKCKNCERMFRQWGDLAYHMISLHSNVRAYVCEFCGKDFARKYSLTVHRRIHTLERDYRCDFCTKTFRASSYLQTHRRIHTGEKPHKCDVCEKPFRVKSDMKRHRLSHTRDREPKPRAISLSKTPINALARGRKDPHQLRNQMQGGSDNGKFLNRSQHEAMVMHNLVAVDESGQIIELEPQIAQQLRAGQVIQVPFGATSTSIGTRQITIEQEDGSLITGDLEPHNPDAEDDEIKEESEDQIQYLESAELVLASENQDPSQGSLYVWPVFMS